MSYKPQTKDVVGLDQVGKVFQVGQKILDQLVAQKGTVTSSIAAVLKQLQAEEEEKSSGPKKEKETAKKATRTMEKASNRKKDESDDQGENKPSKSQDKLSKAMDKMSKETEKQNKKKEKDKEKDKSLFDDLVKWSKAAVGPGSAAYATTKFLAPGQSRIGSSESVHTAAMQSSVGDFSSPLYWLNGAATEAWKLGENIWQGISGVAKGVR